MTEGVEKDLQRIAIEAYVQAYIADNSTVSSLPEVLLQYQEDSLINYYQSSAGYYGMELDEFITTYLGVASIDELLESNKDNLENAANYYLIIQAIAETEDIKVTEEDLTAYFAKYLGTDDYTEYETYYGLPHLMMSTLHQFVLDYIVDNAVLA